MTHRPRRSLVALAVPALLPGLLLVGAPADAAGPRVSEPRVNELSVPDAKETGASHDITEVQVYSGSRQDPSAVQVTFARKPRVGDKVTVWYDFDRDKKPEYMTRLVVGKKLKVFRTPHWKVTKRKRVSSPDCFTLFEGGRGISISVSPTCVNAKRMAVSVTARGQGVTKPDHAPGRRTWTKRVRLVR